MHVYVLHSGDRIAAPFFVGTPEEFRQRVDDFVKLLQSRLRKDEFAVIYAYETDSNGIVGFEHSLRSINFMSEPGDLATALAELANRS